MYHFDTFLLLICFVPYGNRISIDLKNYGGLWRWTIPIDDMIVFHHHNSHHRVIGTNVIITTAVLERPSSQMSYLDHFLKETGGNNSGSTTHTNSGNLVSKGLTLLAVNSKSLNNQHSPLNSHLSTNPPTLSSRARTRLPPRSTTILVSPRPVPRRTTTIHTLHSPSRAVSLAMEVPVATSSPRTPTSSSCWPPRWAT